MALWIGKVLLACLGGYAMVGAIAMKNGWRVAGPIAVGVIYGLWTFIRQGPPKPPSDIKRG